MRFLSFLVTLMSVFISWDFVLAARQESQTTEIDMSAPPFWMSSYDEFNDLQPEQKEFYLKNLSTHLPMISSLSSLTKVQLQDASEWYQSWDRIRKNLYRACQEKATQETCEKIANIRLRTFDMFSFRGHENSNLNKKVPAVD